MLGQLERLREVSEFHDVDLQVLPLRCDENSGLDDSFSCSHSRTAPRSVMSRWRTSAA
ncbi:Scr1 family TA system antitoxin-like transcriptional regulator [Streptomyces parvulus]|uniref:Scr1 family TA system antitoxin-like transcriptional regulator n=1 Tax=Streptomyces parvulus TaxID=146923 RepID=UPI00345291C9